MFNLIVSGFSNLSNLGFQAQASQIVTAMTGNAAFPEPWPATTPTLAQIQADLATFEAELSATMAGDKTRMEARKNARAKLASELAQLALYVLVAAQDDTNILESSGFPLRQRNPRAQSPLPPDPPATVKLTRGPVSGSVLVSASKVLTAGGYEVQLASADPTVESNWTEGGVFKTCRRMELTGLTPFKTYSVRVRALGTAGYGGWSIPTSVAVL